MNSPAAIAAGEPAFLGFRRPEDLFTALADEVTTRLSAAVARRGRAGLVASGGTTPGELYDLLAARDLSWRDVAITLSDERWCDPSSPLSNEHLVRTRLMQDRAAAARLVPLKIAVPQARDAEAAVDAAVAAMPRPFDVVLLGMGTDLHTASLIPGADGLAQALDLGSAAFVRALDPPNLDAMGERMTLTLRAILDARFIALLIRGEAKLAAYRRALATDDVLSAPVGAVLRQPDVPVSVYWTA